MYIQFSRRFILYMCPRIRFPGLLKNSALTHINFWYILTEYQPLSLCCVLCSLVLSCTLFSLYFHLLAGMCTFSYAGQKWRDDTKGNSLQFIFCLSEIISFFMEMVLFFCVEKKNKQREEDLRDVYMLQGYICVTVVHIYKYIREVSFNRTWTHRHKRTRATTPESRHRRTDRNK